MLYFERLEPRALRRADSARWRGFSAFQIAAILALAAVMAVIGKLQLQVLAPTCNLLLAGAFVLSSGLRLILTVASAGPTDAPADLPDAGLPRYTLLCALHDEAEVVGDLIAHLSRLDYPAERLEGFLLLEAHDAATLRAARAARRPDWLEILILPPGRPQTKPRALNHGLAHATGELLTIYDAEDAPHPAQLREAAARFAGDRCGRLACLQVPLRILRRHRGADPSPFVDRQFAAEYAALFEVTLPGLARLGLPFPLGGTSNHFRTAAIRAVGGWDAHNVTEDADLGFRLWREKWRLGVLTRPTIETPPGGVHDWLPQRTRWLKGYLQTFGVHTRWPWRLGARGLAVLLLTVGLGLASSALHGPSLALMLAVCLLSVVDWQAPQLSALALSVLSMGVLSAWLSCAIGARRAGVPYVLSDMLTAPVYWSMQSLAFAHAFCRLIGQPFVWDKTRHRRDAPASTSATDIAALDAGPAPGLSAAHAAAPEPVA